MKKAIETMFTESRHRWHITRKFEGKISSKIWEETDFKHELNKIVWYMNLEPWDFENKWAQLLDDYNLKENKWLSDMFEIKERWIPAYFKEMHMCGLMRTTSGSESENSFFSHFSNKDSTLVNFMMCFETAMEKQLCKQEELDFKTMNTNPKYKTRLRIKRHASNVYKRAVFLLVQTEIDVVVWLCFQKSVNSDERCKVAIIQEKRDILKKDKNVVGVAEKVKEDRKKCEKQFYDFKVIHNTKDGTVVCSCNLFVRRGILCRHIFFKALEKRHNTS